MAATFLPSPQPQSQTQKQLCLACSASLPPTYFRSVASPAISPPSPYANTSNNAGPAVYITPCCSLPICPTCTSQNPRLKRYNPCLKCLGGVGVVGASNANTSSVTSRAIKSPISAKELNLSGEVRDEDTFVVGDEDFDDDDDDLDEDERDDHGPRISEQDFAVDSPSRHTPTSLSAGSTAPDPLIEAPAPSLRGEPPSLSSLSTLDDKKHDEKAQNEPPDENTHETLQDEQPSLRPYKYCLNRSDTIQGLSLRFGVSVQVLCKLNALPPSILRSPHLLHTRSSILLPASVKPHASLVRLTSEESDALEEEDEQTKLRTEERQKERAREKATKRLQMLTKEVDRDVARVYVDLADGGLLDQQEDEEEYSKEAGYDNSGKEKERRSKLKVDGQREGMEYLAIERYLDDMEWEEGHRLEDQSGRTGGSSSSTATGATATRRAWKNEDKEEAGGEVLWSPTKVDDFEGRGVRGLGLAGGVTNGNGNRLNETMRNGVDVLGGWWKKNVAVKF